MESTKNIYNPSTYKQKMNLPLQIFHPFLYNAYAPCAMLQCPKKQTENKVCVSPSFGIQALKGHQSA